MKHKLVLFLLAFVCFLGSPFSTIAFAGPITDSDLVAYYGSCSDSCIEQLEKDDSHANLPKEFTSKFCKTTCLCTAIDIQKKLSIEELIEYGQTEAGKAHDKIDAVIEQCIAKNFPGNK